MVVVVGESDEAVLRVKRCLMDASSSPHLGAVEPAADTLAAGDRHRGVSSRLAPGVHELAARSPEASQRVEASH
uniref:hypothetical protein n=1 Tax=Polynucleobacter sp. TaxID=2029855 RepID=UPI004047D71B